MRDERGRPQRLLSLLRPIPTRGRSGHSSPSQVHLAFQGPFAIAVLLGRLLNTIRTVVYEWDDTAAPAIYRPVVTLVLGYAKSPIVAINA
ncbi:hypothetical protein [Leifsonella bigeumensis]|uniref:hypothetical protein n=1 Tax=Leifsonella bigeumensis TaxID=433643 RepID=UPI003CD0623F